ncbi:MAG: biotin transporter BioY [Lachnospira sp.]|nr:biotin transporter BioY [Lachnospira sp.]
MNRNSKTHELVTIALMASVLCIIAPIVINVGVVPFSFTTFIMYVYLCVFDARKCIVSVLVYVGIGLVGVPVFSGYTAGFGQLVGITGGFIIGYIAMSIVSSMFFKVFKDRRSMTIEGFGVFLGTCVLYVCGVLWYVLVTDNTLVQALMICVLPFILPDVLKMIVAVTVGKMIRKRLIMAGLII